MTAPVLAFCGKCLVGAGVMLAVLFSMAAFDMVLRETNEGWVTPTWVDRLVPLLLALGLTSLCAALVTIAGVLWIAAIKGTAL